MVSQNSQQTIQPTQQPSVQPAPLLPGQGGAQDQAGVSHTHIPPRKHQNQPSVPVSYATIPATSHQSQPMAAHSMQMPQQPKGHLTPQVAPAAVPQSSQLPKIPPPSVHSSSQPHHPTQLPSASSQQPLQTPGFSHMPMQPPLPPQLRPPSVQTFHPQYPPQMGANLGFQHAGGASHNHPQPMYHVSQISQFTVYDLMTCWTVTVFVDEIFSLVQNLLLMLDLHSHWGRHHYKINNHLSHPIRYVKIEDTTELIVKI